MKSLYYKFLYYNINRNNIYLYKLYIRIQKTDYIGFFDKICQGNNRK